MIWSVIVRNVGVRVLGVLLCATIAALPIAAQANTRAGDSAIYYGNGVFVQPGALPQGSWLIPEEEVRPAIWEWLAGGSAASILFAVLASGGSDRRTSQNRSNGAN
ncbi:MAG: hypothetical protein EP341_09055 [Sphingomonadales bacterium]|nr:MAG: hypothetical protein EP341_09055 [Sphingomonadales bacterium]